METHPYYGPGNVIIDSCGDCDLIWLDAGELKQIEHAPGGDRGLRKPVARDTSNTIVPNLRGDVSGPSLLDLLS